MGKSKKKSARKTPIAPDIKVADMIKAYPEAIDVLVEMGFEPLKNPIARKTIGKLFTLEQAANFRGVPIKDMLDAIRKAAGLKPEKGTPEMKEAADKPKTGTVPELKGDVRYLGLVPCPVRNVITDKFDIFVKELTASTGSTIAWWMAGEGTGTKDVKIWLKEVIKNNDFDRIPDVFTAVGTEIFHYNEYGRKLFEKGLFKSIPQAKNSRKEFKNLEDPKGILSLQFVALFTFSCRPDVLPKGLMPKSWMDLTKPEYEGHVAFPSLSLPIIPDILSALYHYLGDDNFEKLASNIGRAMHPSQASPRVGKQDVPGVVIMPAHFTKLATSQGAVHVIPEDGPVAIPAYMVVRKDASKEADAILEYLRSKEFVELIWKYGSFVPNNSDIEIDIEFDKVISRPWEEIYNGDPDRETELLFSKIKPGV